MPMSVNTRSSSGCEKVADEHSYGRPPFVQHPAKDSTPQESSDNCKTCLEAVNESDKALLCNKCKRWQHISCAKVSNNDYKVLKKQTSVMWFCKDNCYEKAESLFAGSLADINSKLDQLVKGFADIQLEKQNSEEILDKRIEEKVKEVIFEEKEKEKRKLNLIAFHVPEAATGSTKMERMTHEQLYLNDILSELKVAAEIEDIVRLGKEVEGKARPLKFKVKTVEVKKEILSEAKELKNNGNETMCKVFICPDRTPKQREENRKLVAELKRRRNAGEDVVIMNGSLKFRSKGSKGTESEPATSGGGSDSE